MKAEEFIVWQCQRCRRLEGDACYRQAAYDYPCSGFDCREPLSHFRAYVLPEWRKPTKEEFEASLKTFRGS